MLVLSMKTNLYSIHYRGDSIYVYIIMLVQLNDLVDFIS